jgi:hypothetical protein
VVLSSNLHFSHGCRVTDYAVSIPKLHAAEDVAQTLFDFVEPSEIHGSGIATTEMTTMPS